MRRKGENNMAPRGRHLIETKDQKMFIMSLVQKKKGSENIISNVPQANRTKGEKKSWLLKGGGDRPFPRKPEKPWAGLTSYWLVYFFIGFHDFTCACGHFLGFVVLFFIGLSHFSLGDKKAWLLRGGGGAQAFS